MDELKIKAFEALIVENCNKTPIPNRVKYYILRDVAQKCLNVSDVDIAIVMKDLEAQKAKESEEKVENGD